MIIVNGCATIILNTLFECNLGEVLRIWIFEARCQKYVHFLMMSLNQFLSGRMPRTLKTGFIGDGGLFIGGESQCLRNVWKIEAPSRHSLLLVSSLCLKQSPMPAGDGLWCWCSSRVAFQLYLGKLWFWRCFWRLSFWDDDNSSRSSKGPVIGFIGQGVKTLNFDPLKFLVYPGIGFWGWHLAAGSVPPEASGLLCTSRATGHRLQNWTKSFFRFRCQYLVTLQILTPAWLFRHSANMATIWLLDK